MAALAATPVASEGKSTPAPHAPTSHPFTCVTCAIAFRSSDLQRTHMRSDWHRYNLKRRIATLPPLSSETFAEKVLHAQASSTAAAAKASYEKLCQACQKTYYSENAYQNHLSSQRHRAREAVSAHKAPPSDADSTSVMSSTISLGAPMAPPSLPESIDDPQIEAEFSRVVDGIRDTKLSQSAAGAQTPTASSAQLSAQPDHPAPPGSSAASTADTQTSTTMPIARCIFCNYDSPNLKLSIMHMTKFHALFLPEQSYLADLEGLITYLQAKVSENHECLFCHKLKNTTGAVQTHMRDKGHCMIAFDTEEEMIEVGQFYDFRSSYSDDEEEEEQSEPESPNRTRRGASKGGKLGTRRRSSGSQGDSGQADDGDGWETDSTDSSVDTTEITAIPIDQDYSRLASHRHHSHHDPRPHRNADGFHSHAHSHHAAFHSDHELHLPTGRTAGHRSLARYYRQNLRNYPTAEEREQQLLLTERNTTAGDEDRDRNSDHEASEASGSRQVERRGRGAVATRADGGTGMLGVSEARKREVRATEAREQRRATRQEKQYAWGVEKRGNNQKHFRDPLLQ